MPRSAVVIGATGLVGGFLVRQLLDDSLYERVVTFARKPLGIGHPKLVEKSFPEGDFASLEMAESDFFSCLGTTIKKAGSKEAFWHIDFELPMEFAKLAKARGVQHFLLVSAIGADSRSLFFYPAVKGKLEEAICSLNFPSTTIVRPSLLLGPRSEYRRGEKIGEGLMSILNPVMFGPLRHLRSVRAQDVAACLIHAAKKSRPGVHIIESGDICKKQS